MRPRHPHHLVLAVLLLLALPGACIARRHFTHVLVVDAYTPVTDKEIKEAADIDAWNMFYSYARLRNDEWSACFIADQAMTNVCIYRLDPYLFARVIWQESWFSISAKSFLLDSKGDFVRDKKGRVIPIGWGLTQLNLAVNWGCLLKAWNGKELIGRVKDAETAKEVVLNPYYNLAAGGYLLRYYLDMYASERDDDKRMMLALTSFWAGPYSAPLRELRFHGKDNHYVVSVMNPTVFEFNVTTYHGFYYVKKKRWERPRPLLITNFSPAVKG